MIERWQAMARDGREFEAWDEITHHAEELREDEVHALIRDLGGWPGSRPMPYRWWERCSRGEWAPWLLLADHRVLFADFEMRVMEDPDAHEEFYGTSAMGDETWSPDGPRALFTSEEAAMVIDGRGRTLWMHRTEDPGLLVAAFTPGGHALVTVGTYPAEITAWFLDRDVPSDLAHE